jgi:DNA-binding NtrC family response regulator
VSWIQVMVAGAEGGRRTSLVNVLTECGLEPVVASTLQEIHTILSQQTVHVMFCDDNPHGGSFREILPLVKTARPEVQVVVSSMLRDLDEYIEAINLGAFDFVAPPYRGADIVSIVDSACERYRLKRNDDTMFYIQEKGLPQGRNL